MTDGGATKERCLNCGRIVFSDRPACLYCGTNRNISQSELAALKKKIVDKAVAKDEDQGKTIRPSWEAAAPSPSSADVRICAKCGESVVIARNFCTSCGNDMRNVPVQEAPQSGDAVPHASRKAQAVDLSQQPAPAPAEVAASEKARPFSNRETAMLGLSAILALACVAIPFGLIKADPGKGILAAKLGCPFVIVLLYIFSFFMAYMNHRNVLVFENGEKSFKKLHVGILLAALLTGSSVLKIFSHAIEAIILSVPAHIAAASILKKRGPEYFWDAACLIAALTLLIYTPYTYILYLKDADGILAMPGFIAHALALAVYLAAIISRISGSKAAAAN